MIAKIIINTNNNNKNNKKDKHINRCKDNNEGDSNNHVNSVYFPFLNT